MYIKISLSLSVVDLMHAEVRKDPWGQWEHKTTLEGACFCPRGSNDPPHQLAETWVGLWPLGN